MPDFIYVGLGVFLFVLVGGLDVRLARLDGVAENPKKVAPFLFQF